MLLLLQVRNIHDSVVHPSTVLSPASPCIHPLPFVSFLTLQPALAALLQEFCSWRCTLLPFSSLAGDTVPCPQKVQSMVLNFYVKGKFWILHGTPTAALCCSLHHAPSITFLFASMTRLAGEEEEIQEGEP